MQFVAACFNDGKFLGGSMNRRLKTICAIGSTLLLLVSFLLIFIFSWIDGYVSTILCVCGLFTGFVFAPIVHELGHIDRKSVV